ncbi:MAG: DUF5615 family PIN-like protein [Fimbriimonadales bacterium]|nr:DUF5615 family PIN-like protein [Fimbriimonadales bacterium]
MLAPTIRLAADENFDSAILDGLIRRIPQLDVKTVQQVGLRNAPDKVVLKWAASEERVLLTHDWRTLPHDAMARVQHGEPMPGVIVVPREMPIGQAIAELELIVVASLPHELEGRVLRLPLSL